MIVSLDHHGLETFDHDARVKRALVQGYGRGSAWFGRVIHEQDAETQGEHVDAHANGKHAGKAEPDVQEAGGQGADGGRQRQDGGREPDAHGAVRVVRYVGKVREHANEETVIRAGHRHRDGLRDAGDHRRHPPEHGEQHV